MTAGETLGSVFPISVSFVQGEQPASGKFSGWANQTSAGLNKLAKSVGDLWGEEFGSNRLYVDWRRPPHIMNLARLVGPASAINPLRPVGPAQRVEYDVELDPDDIPAKVNEFNLRGHCDCEPPIDYSGGAIYPLGGVEVHDSIHDALNTIDSGVFGELVDTRAAVNGTGKYYVDTHGNVITYDRTGTYSGDSETYQTVMVPDMYDQATLNVIPDMNQETSDGLCDVIDIGSNEFVVRTPYLVKLARRDAFGSPLEPGDVGCPPVSFKDPTDGQRARLPYALKAADGMNLSGGDVIPDGFMGLWDESNDRMVTGLTFKLSDEGGYSSDYCVIVSGADLTESSDQYRIITVGTTITELLGNLVRRVDTHTHNTRESGFPVWHDNLVDKTILPSIVSAKWSIEVSSPPSTIVGNDHPQYLCRYGWLGSVDAGQYDNAMLGDIFMAAAPTSSDYIANGYAEVSKSSRFIYFASTDCSVRYSKVLGGFSGLSFSSGEDSFLFNSDGTTAQLLIGNQFIGGDCKDISIDFYRKSTHKGQLTWHASDTSERGFAFLHQATVKDAWLQVGNILLLDENDPINNPGGTPAGVDYLAIKALAGGHLIRMGQTSGRYTALEGGVDKFNLYGDQEIEISNNYASRDISITTEGTNSHINLTAEDASNINLWADGNITLTPKIAGIVTITQGNFDFSASTNVRMPTTASAGAVAGSFYFNVSGGTKQLYIHDGSGWRYVNFT